MSSLSTLPKGDSAWLLRKSIQRVMQQVSVLETNIGSSTTGNSANTQIIFNDAGTLRGDAQFTWNKTLNRLTVDGDETITGDLMINNDATITGDLTVDTNVLKVDTLNNRVGIGTASPLYALDVRGNIAGGNGTIFGGVTFSSRTEIGALSNHDVGIIANSVTQYLIAVGGTHTWYNSGSTAMTLNSTGLGVFNSPVAALDVYKVANDTINRTNATFCFGQIAGLGAALLGQQSASAPYQFNLQAANAANSVQFPLVLQPSGGNVGVGVTPSAWAAGFKVVQFGPGSALSCNTNASRCDVSANYFYDGANKFITASGYATNLTQENGNFYFYRSTATSGGAGAACTFTQAMTLDASGNLLVGTTSVGGVNGITLQPSATTPTVVTVGSASTGGTAYLLYSTGASANRFYVTYAGTVFATNTTISAISDARFKENVQDIDVGLGAILALKPRKFDWKAGKGKDIKGDRGFIAQEFEQVFPNLVDDWADPAPEGEAPYKSVRQDLIPVLVKAIQELAAEVNALKNA